jgi:hypothetical protein
VNINAGRPGAVSNRQISNWIYQRKKSGWRPILFRKPTRI